MAILGVEELELVIDSETKVNFDDDILLPDKNTNKDLPLINDNQEIISQINMLKHEFEKKVTSFVNAGKEIMRQKTLLTLNYGSILENFDKTGAKQAEKIAELEKEISLIEDHKAANLKSIKSKEKEQKKLKKSWWSKDDNVSYWTEFYNFQGLINEKQEFDENYKNKLKELNPTLEVLKEEIEELPKKKQQTLLDSQNKLKKLDADYQKNITEWSNQIKELLLKINTLFNNVNVKVDKDRNDVDLQSSYGSLITTCNTFFIDLLKKINGLETEEPTYVEILKKIIEEIENIKTKFNANFETIENQKRIQTGNWVVNDVMAVDSILGIDDVKTNELIHFKVLAKIEEKFVVIIKYLNANNEEISKMRNITVADCGTFNFTDVKTETNLENIEDIKNNQLLLNDYILSKNEKIKECINLLKTILQTKDSQITLTFVTNNSENEFNNWEWDINIENIKIKLVAIIDDCIEGRSDAKYNIATLLTLREKIINNKFFFEITTENKNSITRGLRNKNQANIEVNFNISVVYDENLYTGNIGKINHYQMQIPVLVDSVNKNSEVMVKQRIEFINQEVKKLVDLEAMVNQKFEEVFNELNSIKSQLVETLEAKQKEYENWNNHTNFSIHNQNQEIILNLLSEINTTDQQLKTITASILKLEAKKNTLFDKEFKGFIEYYCEEVSKVEPLYEKCLHWDTQFNAMKGKLQKINLSYKNFDDYQATILNQLEANKTESIEINKQFSQKLAKTKIKKLSWWQKLRSRLFWTRPKKISAINDIKTNIAKKLANKLMQLEKDTKESNTKNKVEIYSQYQQPTISEKISIASDNPNCFENLDIQKINDGHQNPTSRNNSDQSLTPNM